MDKKQKLIQASELNKLYLELVRKLELQFAVSKSTTWIEVGERRYKKEYMITRLRHYTSCLDLFIEKAAVQFRWKRVESKIERKNLLALTKLWNQNCADIEYGVDFETGMLYYLNGNKVIEEFDLSKLEEVPVSGAAAAAGFVSGVLCARQPYEIKVKSIEQFWKGYKDEREDKKREDTDIS